MATYRNDARLDRVIDGDTYEMHVDLGYRCEHTIHVRLADVDTHEIYGVKKESAEYQAGDAERDWVTAWFTEGEANYDGDWPFVVTSYEAGKYAGRWIADVTRTFDGASLAAAVVAEFGDEVAHES